MTGLRLLSYGDSAAISSSVAFQVYLYTIYISHICLYSEAVRHIARQRNILEINIYSTMVSWDSLIRFAAEDSAEYWAALALDETPKVGLQVEGFASIEDLESDKGAKKVIVKKVRAFRSRKFLSIC